MMHLLQEHPGLWFVVATLLPLASFLILLLAGGTRWLLRGSKPGSPGEQFFKLLGGEVTGRGPAYVATAAIFLAFVCCLIGGVQFFMDPPHHDAPNAQAGHGHDHHGHEVAKEEKHDEKHDEHGGRWEGSIVWAQVGAISAALDSNKSTTLKVGYYLDHLSVIMFLMVTFIATLIHIFSIGYMSDELQKTVEDHEIHTDHGHFHRRGRFGRFFLFLSLFCFSMLNLILADNLFQVFVSWELVGVCSFLLIGFYYERTSASNAANKAFITNRVGDAGFIIGLLIVWTYFGTLNFQEVFQRIRVPDNFEGLTAQGGQILRGSLYNRGIWAKEREYEILHNDVRGQVAFILPKNLERVAVSDYPDHVERFDKNPSSIGKVIVTKVQPGPLDVVTIPYWMLVAAGLGIFLGCVGKSAQFPLQVWLPDAMEGPTPVSALIHAATMVAAGVYLVGRCFPLFTAEVLLTIAYTGGITLFVAASIALVVTDIKKVLAYSTVSQLGYMMLGLGVGGWSAGLFHLVTHAFFKALMFLASGSVIYGCHHVQDMGRMGGLYPKMKITALTMLMGVLAICGIPAFSGWYSKDAILASALGFISVHPEHLLLFLLPLMTAGMTTFYMFRMWFMTFTGEPRDHHVYEHAHETPPVMTTPLIILAVFSVCVGWGWPFFSSHFPFVNAESSLLEHQLHHSQPRAVTADFGFSAHDAPSDLPAPENWAHSVRFWAGERHELAGNLALGVVLIGLIFAYLVHHRKVLDPADAIEQFPGVHRFLQNKWCFDELYSAILVRPAVVVAGWASWFDRVVLDGILHGFSYITVVISWLSGLADRNIVDGLVNLVATVSQRIGARLRGVQTGYIRSYVLFLVLAAIGLYVLLLPLR